MAIINGKTFSIGEQGRVQVDDEIITLKCDLIEDNVVFVKIEGETTKVALALGEANVCIRRRAVNRANRVTE